MLTYTITTHLLFHACLTLTAAQEELAPCSAPTPAPETIPFERAFTPSGEKRYTTQDFPLPLYYVGEPPEGLDTGDIQRAIQGAVATWNDVPCSAAALSYEGEVAKLEDVPDGGYVIGHFTEESASCLKAGDVSRIGAAPCIIGPRDLRATAFNRDKMRWYMLDEATQVRTWQEDELPWIDFRAALTHELGHLLGLNHPASGVHTPRATMFANYRVDGGQSKLAATDRAHLCALYPTAPASPKTCASDDACAQALDDPGATCVTLDMWKVCDKESGEDGAYCADNLLICEDLCLISSPETRTGYCTTRCQDDEACAPGWQCDLDGLISEAPQERGVCKPVGEPEEEGCQQTPASPAPLALWCGLLGLCFVARRKLFRKS